MNIDQPLEVLIKADSSGKRQPRRSNEGRKRSSASRSTSSGGKATAPPSRGRGAQAPLSLPPARGNPALGSKIILSNLPTDVTEGQVRELFTSSLGPVKKVVMNYRQNGVSTGTCTVIFARAEDGQKAYEQYNNRLIDGKRPLRIEVVVDLAKIPTPRAQGPAPQGRNPRNPAPARGGRRGARAGAGAPSAPRPKKTLEDLDAEMEDYAKAGADAGPSA